MANSNTAWPGATSPGLTRVIPSYLYQEYADDDNLQAMRDAYNQVQQQYVDWFNQVSLPVYTSALVSGALLDWVAQGLYGLSRPLLPIGHDVTVGPYNTAAYNTLPYNALRTLTPDDASATTDDTFKRILTWRLYKGDGRQFNIEWLKRRVTRFLFGVNGIDPPVDQTYRVSVTFGVGNQVNINILSEQRMFHAAAVYGRFAYNTRAYNAYGTSFIPLPPLAAAATLKSAVDAGVLDLPFQFDFVVNL